MWKKFKELKLGLKIIVGIIAIIFLPVTLLLLSVELLIKSIKSKKKILSVVSVLLVLVMLFINYSFIEGFKMAQDPEYIAQLEAEEQAQKEKEEAEQKAKQAQEQKEKEEAEQKAKEEQEQKEKEEAEAKAKQAQEQKEKEANKKFEYVSIGTPTERPVMNGTKTERIGTYLDAVCNNKTLTDKELIQFYKDYVRDTDYNWVQLRFSDGKGLHFSGNYFTYCTLDVENGISSEKGNGVIYPNENKVEYDGKDYTK